MAMLRLSCSKIVRQGILPAVWILSQKSPLAVSHYSFSTASSDAIKQIDLKLAGFLDSEIATRKMDPMPKLSGFPFTVVNDDSSRVVKMTRDFDGERIDVFVFMPDHIYAFDGDSGSDDSLDLDVTIRKQNGRLLKFELTIDSQEITVIELSSLCSHRFDMEEELEEELEELEEELELDENLPLRKESDITREGDVLIREYLAARGVNKDYYPFLKDLVIHKSTKLRLYSLHMLRKSLMDHN